MNRSFGVQFPISLKEKRAFEITQLLSLYDFVMDFHNTNDSTTCAIVCNSPNDLQKRIASYFGFQRIVIMPKYGCLIGIEPEKSVSLEISEMELDRFNVTDLAKKIEALSMFLDSFKNITTQNLSIYEFVTSLKKVTFRRLQKKWELSKTSHRLLLNKKTF